MHTQHTHTHTNLAIDIVVRSYARIKIVSARLDRLGDVALAAVGRARVEDDEGAVQRLPVSWSLTTTASELRVEKITQINFTSEEKSKACNDSNLEQNCGQFYSNASTYT